MLKKVWFNDNDNNKCYAVVSLDSSILTIVAYNENNESIGNLQVLISDRIYLSEIICNRYFYRKGVGTALLNIFEYLYKDYTGIVYGKFCPFDIALNTTQNDEVGRSFYNKNGYEIVSKKEFMDHEELYPGLQIDDFKHSSRIYNFSLIYKKNIQKEDYRFIEENDELVEKEKVKSLNKDIF